MKTGWERHRVDGPGRELVKQVTPNMTSSLTSNSDTPHKPHPLKLSPTYIPPITSTPPSHIVLPPPSTPHSLPPTPSPPPP